MLQEAFLHLGRAKLKIQKAKNINACSFGQTKIELFHVFGTDTVYQLGTTTNKNLEELVKDANVN